MKRPFGIILSFALAATPVATRAQTKSDVPVNPLAADEEDIRDKLRLLGDFRVMNRYYEQLIPGGAGDIGACRRAEADVRGFIEDAKKSMNFGKRDLGDQAAEQLSGTRPCPTAEEYKALREKAFGAGD